MDNVDKYSVSQYSVKSLLGYIDAGDIAIPEIPASVCLERDTGP